jgi:hypothetical protein
MAPLIKRATLLTMTGKIALAHLTEFPDHYTRLAKMEAEAKSFWDSKKS